MKIRRVTCVYGHEKESPWLIKELGFAKMISEILISPAVLWAVWICAMDNKLTAQVVDVVFIKNSFFTAVTWHHHVATLSFLNLSENLHRKAFAIN